MVSKHIYNSNGVCTVCGTTKNGALAIISQPKDIHTSMDSVCDGDIYTFNVRANGNGNLKYQWYRKYSSAPEGFCYKIQNDSTNGVSGATSNSLKTSLPTDGCSDTISYWCVITDSNGNSIKTREAVVKIKHSFVIDKKTTNVKTHTLKCVSEDCDAVKTEAHSYGNWYEKTPGVNARVCSECGYEQKLEAHTQETRNVLIVEK